MFPETLLGGSSPVTILRKILAIIFINLYILRLR